MGAGAGPASTTEPGSSTMFGLADGVPVAGYGPRGSAEAVANIRGAVIPGVPAVLLANHGVLVFHRTPDLAILTGSVVEEAAQAGLSAQGLGRSRRDPAGTAGRGPAARHGLRQPGNRPRLIAPSCPPSTNHPSPSRPRCAASARRSWPATGR